MESTGFKVVFEGQIRLGADERQVKDRLATLFRVDQSRIESLFSGRQVVIKRVVELKQGLKYVAALRRAGAIARIIRG